MGGGGGGGGEHKHPLGGRSPPGPPGTALTSVDW